MKEIEATLEKITYTPFLNRTLNEYTINDIKDSMPGDSSFFLKFGENKFAVSYWVSPKRTRSYPYERVYDTLRFSGKKVTIIPVIKDEGSEGDRDYLQWDTISLMSLLQVYTIIAYYKDGQINRRYNNKITNQKFDMPYISGKLSQLLSYQSEALHWNLEQINEISEIGEKAIEAYSEIFSRYGLKMHDKDKALKRIEKIMSDRNKFREDSRNKAREAQNREALTEQPKESLNAGEKAKIQIKNYYGGFYYLTVDEARFEDDRLYLVEGKNTTRDNLPSISDIKDGLFKMIIFSNLSEVKIENQQYRKFPMLKLTGKKGSLTSKQQKTIDLLKEEADANNFHIMLNDTMII